LPINDDNSIVWLLDTEVFVISVSDIQVASNIISRSVEIEQLEAIFKCEELKTDEN
jgi:hypothetical protein